MSVSVGSSVTSGARCGGWCAAGRGGGGASGTPRRVVIATERSPDNGRDSGSRDSDSGDTRDGAGDNRSRVKCSVGMLLKKMSVRVQ